MKSILISGAMLLVLTSQAFANSLQTIEGKVVFSKGEYYLQNQAENRELTGLSMQQLRHYEGRTVKVAGELEQESIEVYKIFVKTDSGYEASYDWDVVNQDLYAD